MTAGSGAASSRWLRSYRPRRQPRLRLVCFPHAGGTASFFREWADLVPPSIEVLAVQYPGREDRIEEGHVQTMEQLADLAVRALVPASDVPLALFGHSLGAAVAYEVALRLEERRVPLARLFVSGRRAPSHQGADTKHLLDDDRLWEEIRGLGGTSEEVLRHRELRALILPSVRNDYRVSETWRPRVDAIVATGVVACVGNDDPEVTVDEASAWAEVTSDGFALHVFAGDHFYLVPQRRELVAAVVRGLGGFPDLWPSAP